MPVKLGKDSKGNFAKWGDSGSKYYYTPNNKDSRENAKKKAGRQGKAIIASGYKE